MILRSQPIQRTIAAIVLATFTSLSLYPLTAAAQAKATVEKADLLLKQQNESTLGNVKRFGNGLAGKSVPAKEQGPDEKFSQLLASIHDELKAVVPQTALAFEAKKHSNGKIAAGNTGERIKNLRVKAKEVQNLYADIDKGFKDTEQQLKDKKLPKVILERHAQAVAQYEARKAEFDRLTKALEAAPDNSSAQQQALANLGSFMAEYPNAKPHQYTDPNKLPFVVPSGKVREPYTSKEQYQASLFPPKYEKVMLASLSMDGIQLAQAALPQTPTVADTAETEDAQITQAIKDQAAALGNNPVKIYNWVRNNIQFIPSYGSIQGSDMTLMNKRGNAFDTASLLIAMLRAAGTPARYVYGTIEVPVDKVMNWVGGVTTAGAAQSLLGQGGIPNVGLTSGGVIKAFRMEHVWVEAYVDHTPSRGALNKNPSTWVPMDASFKQYVFTQGMDIKNNVPFDSQTLLSQLQQGATVDQTSGYVQNLNVTNLQGEMTAYQAQVKSYIDQQLPNATPSDITGKQNTQSENYSIIPGSLPYKLLIAANTFQSLPDTLKWKFKTNIYPGGWYPDSSSSYIEINQSTAKLAGKKITLSFIAATQADQDLINSYLPKPHADGTPIQPNELPTNLPGYLLKVRAEFRVDGQVIVQTTDSFTMGSTVRQSSQYFNPGTGTWQGGDDNDLIVGEYNAIGLNLQGASPELLLSQRSKLTATLAKLTQYQQNPADITPIEKLNKDDLTGDILQAGMLGYFAFVDANDLAGEKSNGGVINYRAPSYGRFFATATPRFYFGIVRTVQFLGAAMDVDYLVQQVVAKDDNSSARVDYLRHIGSAGSAAEHLIPQHMFGDIQLAPNDPTGMQGVSAVKMLNLAALQGQKIYRLTATNKELHSSIIASLQIGTDEKYEISNSLASGMEVTVHEKDINVNGWVGCGYIILDPATGAGVYKISGGTNGSYLYIASQYRLVYGAMAWNKIRTDRTASERGGGYSEAVRNAEHFLYAYELTCDDGQSRASVVLLTYLYFIGKALIWDANSLFNSSVTIPGVGTFDFRKSPVTFEQLVAGLHGAAYGSRCGL